jgi:hypothetical protein
MSNLDPIWMKKVECPYCQNSFKIENLRIESIHIKDRETDFKPIYDGLNPNWYLVWVCPRCYYAAFKSDFLQLSPKQKEALKVSLGERMYMGQRYDFTRARNRDLALASFQIAIICYKYRYKKRSLEKIANLYLRSAWIEREAGNLEKEKEYLLRAQSEYEAALQAGFGYEMTPSQIQYLIGEINRRIGNYEKAFIFLKKVIDNKYTESKIKTLAEAQYELCKKESEVKGSSE